QALPAADLGGLVRRPSPEPRPAAASREVGVGLLGAQSLDRALEPDLAIQRLPQHGERRAGILSELAALAALVVRVEGDAALVDALEQHEAHRRRAVGGCRGERHGLGLDDARGDGALVPLAEKGERIGHIAIAMYLISRYSSMPSLPPSRPKPEALTPPNGA